MTITGRPREIEMNLDNIAGGPRLLRDDGHVAARQRIQQARLAGVGRSGDDHAEAVAQALAAPVGEMMRDAGEELRHDGIGLDAGVRGDVGLVGEIESGFDKGLRLDQLLTPALIERPRPALALGQSLARLRLGLGGDEIGKALDLGEIEPAILEGAARELAGLGETHVIHGQQGANDEPNHGAAAMNMELAHVLAGEASRPGQPEHEAAVEEIAAPGILQLAQARVTRRRQRTAKRAERGARRQARTRGSRQPLPGLTRLPARKWCPAISPRPRSFARGEKAPILAAIGGPMTDAQTNPAPGENRLGRETSPYLLQHKDNPVHWWAWGPEALAEAKRTGKPILLSVGYAACHWCHVMAHESFEDDATAAVMNDLFVNIKVDREERPDVDAIYMSALHELGEHGGWPLTMFLTADAEPFWGGTYFPNKARYGRPGFVDVLRQVARVYRDEQAVVRNNADALRARLAPKPDRGKGDMPGDAALADLAQRLTQIVDPVNGGVKGAPKFPQPQLLNYLWRGGLRYGLDLPQTAVALTLNHIAQGGIYDHLGGGFARYSVDDRWLVPHFEKMLYDNALLVELMTEAVARAEGAALGAAHRRDHRLAVARDGDRRRRLCLIARRRQRGRGGEVLCVVARRDRRGAGRGGRAGFRRRLRREPGGQLGRQEYSQ